MDINAITLKCLMNPQHYDNYNQKLADTKNVDEQKEKHKFYKKRILSLTKEMFKDKFPNKETQVVFGQYTDSLISYFEFLDKKDIIQEEYNDYKKKDTSSSKTNEENTQSANQLLINTPISQPKTLDDFVTIKTANIKQEIPPPQRKIINLRDNKLRNKGLKK